MTTTSAFTDTTSDAAAVRRASLPAGISALAVALFFTIARADSNAERISMSALEIVASALLFGLVVPRALRRESAGGRGLAIGVIAVLLVVPAFWSGLPMLLGACAALIGYAGKRADTGSGKAMASLVLGLLAVIGYVAFYVLDYLSTLGVM
jgi:hypothetical protein